MLIVTRDAVRMETVIPGNEDENSYRIESIMCWSSDLHYNVGMSHLQDPYGTPLRHGSPLELLLFKLGA